jgi:hypothetical protein
MDWDELAGAMWFLMESNFSDTRVLMHSQRCVLLGFLRVKYQIGTNISLLSLLRAFSGNEATDSKDHILALLTLVGGEVDHGIFSYDRSFSELSIATTRMVAVDYKRLDPLKFVFGTSTEHQDGLPSWVADWRPSIGARPDVIEDSSSSLWEGGLGSGILNATNGPEYIARFPELANQMTVQGKVIESIVQMSESFGDTWDTTSNSLFELPGWKKWALDATRNIYLGEAQLYANFVYRDVQFHRAEEKIKYSCLERRLVITSSGNLGVVPRRAIVGDKVCPLMGSDVPYILRAAVEHTWFVIGHCYVDGIMNGEAFVEEECDNMVLV